MPAYSHKTGIKKIAWVPMRDNIKLHTEIFFPEGKGPFPVILIRNPYAAGLFSAITAQIFIRYGYACMLQSVRGQNESEGKWIPLDNEFNDSEDAAKWLAKQKWQNGNIALYGPSYTGFTQWAAADRLPKEVKTMIPLIIGTDFYPSVYTDGMLHHEFISAWAYLMPGRNIRSDNGEKYKKAIRYRPFIEADGKYLKKKLPWFRDWITNSAPGSPYWKRKDAIYINSMPKRVKIPVLMIGGWFDVFFKAQINDWKDLATQKQSRYVVGPWTHGLKVYGDKIMPNAEGTKIQWNEVLPWLDHHLRGKEYKKQRGVVSAYTIGSGTWNEYKNWPPETKKKNLYLQASKKTCPQGALKPEKNTLKKNFSYTYDPDNPVPTKGGSNMLAFIVPGFSDITPGPVIQAKPCTRKDIITFISSPLNETKINGSMKTKFYVSSSARDTAFSITISEIQGDGKAINMRHSITTLAFRNDSKTAKKYKAGTVVPVTLKTSPIAWTLKKGSHIRLDISSSNFPLYHIHPNVKGHWAKIKNYKKAKQTIHLSKEKQSFIELPLQ
jgi:putative CocE/NonD family hydrolase